VKGLVAEVVVAPLEESTVKVVIAEPPVAPAVNGIDTEAVGPYG
jgi:hypothetical protein